MITTIQGANCIRKNIFIKIWKIQGLSFKTLLLYEKGGGGCAEKMKTNIERINKGRIAVL
jgi:hypothetical protein